MTITTDHAATPRARVPRRSTSPEQATPVWASSWTDAPVAPAVPIEAGDVVTVEGPPAAPAPRTRRTWRDRLWQLLGVLAVLLPMLGLVLAATTGQELWLVPAAVVAAAVAVALTIWT